MRREAPKAAMVHVRGVCRRFNVPSKEGEFLQPVTRSLRITRHITSIESGGPGKVAWGLLPYQNRRLALDNGLW